jgi:hypothetical protein
MMSDGQHLNGTRLIPVQHREGEALHPDAPAIGLPFDGMSARRLADGFHEALKLGQVVAPSPGRLDS